MNGAFLSMMSGPLAALLRYGISVASGAALASHAVPDNVVAQGAAFLGTLVPVVIGMLTSTKAAAVAKVADLDGFKVTTPVGTVLSSAADAQRAPIK